MRKTKTIKSILVNYVTTVINTDMETMDASVFKIFVKIFVHIFL